MNYTIRLGSNRILDCKAVLVIDGVEVFRLRERSGDGHLVVDFKVLNREGETLIVVAKNNVVYAAIGFVIKNSAHEARVEDADGRVYARVVELDSGVISIEGKFCVNGTEVAATPETLMIGTNEIRNLTMRRLKQAVVIENGMLSIG